MTGRLLAELEALAARAIKTGLDVDAPPEVRETSDPTFGDYQINGVLPLAKVLRDNPRKLAMRVAEVFDSAGMCDSPVEVAGPGFINLRLSDAWLAARVGEAAADPRLGVAPLADPSAVVIDFSSPNVAKRMHVGHLRSTIIGDALARTLRFLGHDVVGDNHVGDWGTQFGVLLWAWKQRGGEVDLETDPIGELEALYKFGSAASREDAEVADACRAELAALQVGDPERQALWERFVAISRQDAERTYDRLGVSFDTWHGESFYHDRLAGVVERLVDRGIAEESDGALAIFFEEAELEGKPFLVRKSDGAYLYATTDLATLDYRVETYSPERVIYVVDVRQSLHFRQLFTAARRLGHDVTMEHVGFGMMMGADGRPFRTRDGGTITLEALLDEAEERILPIVTEKWPDATEEEQRAIAAQVGIGAVKYADLAQNLTTDYRFDWDKLLAADGNTGPYLQYTLVRIRSVLREHAARTGASFAAAGAPIVIDTPEERALAIELLRLGDVFDRVGRLLRPHIACEYLYGLARTFNPFYARCRILNAETEALRASRLALCEATGRALEIGLDCLNIPLLQRM